MSELKPCPLGEDGDILNKCTLLQVITAMYDQIHEERDTLRKQLDIAVEALKKSSALMHEHSIFVDSVYVIIDDALAEIDHHMVTE